MKRRNYIGPDELRGVKKDINVEIELVTRGKAIFTFSGRKRRRRRKKRSRRRRNALRAAPAAECTPASRTRCSSRFLVRPNGFVSRIQTELPGIAMPNVVTRTR